MSGVSPLTVVLLIWAVITGAFIIVMIYRSLLSMKEDDQLFLDPAESKLEADQKAIMRKVNRITPWAKGLGFASLGLLVLSGGMWVYVQMTASALP